MNMSFNINNSLHLAFLFRHLSYMHSLFLASRGIYLLLPFFRRGRGGWGGVGKELTKRERYQTCSQLGPR